MQIANVLISVNAKDFIGLSEWWSKLLDCRWDREPMPSCHEWDVAGCVFFQVLDNPKLAGKATVTLRITNLRGEIERLAQHGIQVPRPTKVQGFENLIYSQFSDPEGNEVGLLEGA